MPDQGKRSGFIARLLHDFFPGGRLQTQIAEPLFHILPIQPSVPRGNNTRHKAIFIFQNKCRGCLVILKYFFCVGSKQYRRILFDKLKICPDPGEHRHQFIHSQHLTLRKSTRALSRQINSKASLSEHDGFFMTACTE